MLGEPLSFMLVVLDHFLFSNKWGEMLMSLTSPRLGSKVDEPFQNFDQNSKCYRTHGMRYSKRRGTKKK